MQKIIDIPELLRFCFNKKLQAILLDSIIHKRMLSIFDKSIAEVKDILEKSGTNYVEFSGFQLEKDENHASS